MPRLTGETSQPQSLQGHKIARESQISLRLRGIVVLPLPLERPGPRPDDRPATVAAAGDSLVLAIAEASHSGQLVDRLLVGAYCTTTRDAKSFRAELGAAKNHKSIDGQGETPNSFSMSAIIGCVKPALRNAAKSSAMARSHSVPYCSDIGLPLWAK
jgi:hypothetical protein